MSLLSDAALETQYLTFTLGEEDFCLEISKVKEVLECVPVTPIPRMPDFLMGVINLRGTIVPVVDLRRRLDMGQIDQTIETSIIIVEIMFDGELCQMGALTDAVKEVIELDWSRISPAPPLGTRIKNKFIKGIGQLNQHFLTILNIERIFSETEFFRPV